MKPMNENVTDIGQCLMSYEELNRQLNLILDCSADGIWVLDRETRVLNVNKAAEELNAIKTEDVIGKTVTELVDSGLFDRAISPEVLARCEQVTIYEKTKKTNKVLLYTGTPSFDNQGNIAYIVVNERDVTQMNTLREELEQSRMIAEKFKDELTWKSVLEYKTLGIVAESVEMRQIVDAALKLARIEASNILLLGKSGTGKGLLAKFIHQNCSRKNNPLIQINCAALPETLLEAELFGYEKGAFTGASEQGKAGLFELAHRGVLFLDEIGDLPLPLQAKLLKYLDDHQIIRLGGTRSHWIDCMVIAATNRNLDERVREGKFRQDLLYRLNTFTVKIPTLAERPADILELVNHYLKKYNDAYHQKKRISQKGYAALLQYRFPGNVRELKNILKRAAVMCESELLDNFIAESLPPTEPAANQKDKKLTKMSRLADAVEKVERDLFKTARAQCRTTRAMAAVLGVSHATVVRKMQKYGLNRSAG
jgi:PAS domain S-box-containing protein/TyrR family helix-turn-helix protein